MLSRNLTWMLIALMALLAVGTVAAQDATTLPPANDAEAAAGELVEVTENVATASLTAIDRFINSLVQTPQSDLGRLLLIIGGVVLLVAGWRLYEYIIVIAGFVVGAMIGLSLVVTDSTVLAVLVLLVGGLIGALLSIFLYYVAVFFIGAYVGIVLTGAAAAALSLAPVSPIALLIGGIIGGLVMLAVSVEFLVLLSVITGAQMLALGLGLGVAWVLIFAVIGLIAQLFLVRTFNYDLRRRPRRINPLRRFA